MRIYAHIVANYNAAGLYTAVNADPAEPSVCPAKLASRQFAVMGIGQL